MIHNTITMKLLALTLPGPSGSNYIIPAPSGLKPEFTNLSSVISPLLTIAFYIAAFLAFYFLIWGAFAYIMAQGNKENLAKARARISFALIGLIVILMAYFIAKYAGEIFAPDKGGLPF